jgi:predicted nucleic acid-binding protein
LHIKVTRPALFLQWPTWPLGYWDQSPGLGFLLIATSGLTHNLTVVTHNTREFARIDGLKLQDWEL